MSGVGPITILFAFLALLAVGLVLNWFFAERRREEMNALALRLGWAFDPFPDRGFDDLFHQFDAFNTGHGREATNTLSGTLLVADRKFPVRMGDFSYRTTSSNGKTTTETTHRLSYILVRLPFAAVPDLLIRREGLLDKAAAMLGFEDINFESSEFSRRFFVRCIDKKFAFDVIHPRMMEFMLGGSAPTVDVRGGWLCVLDGKRRWKPGEFPARLDWLERFFALWPDYLTRQLESA